MADLPNPKYRKERYLYNIASGTTSELPQPKSREERYLYEIANNGGGGGGTTNYNQLSNKPKVNNVELSGNKTTRDLIPIGNGLNFNEDGELEATGGGSGAVDSVNGKTGVVVLDAEDVGALPDDTDIPDSLSDLTEDSTHRTVTDTEKSTWNGKSDFSGNYNDLSNKPSIPDSTSDLTNDSGFITNTVNNLVNYYLKSETYTQAEVNALISAIVTLDIQAVSTLPTEDISRTTIYLVPSSDPQSQNIKDEYINLDGTSSGWELIGSTEIDLSGYVTDTELTTALADYTTTANLTLLLANKANSSDVEDIEALIPSNASSSNKLITLSDVPKGTATDCPIGMTAFFDDDTAPSGWLVADGTVYNIADYPFLANHYERVHGSKNYWGGNGTTTFAVPDWQGEFLRASGTNSHTNQGSGANVGEHQDATGITNTIERTNNVPYINSDGTNGTKAILYGETGSTNYNATYFNVRPTNTSLLLCIKATPAGINYSTEEQVIGTWVDGKKIYQKTVELGSELIMTGNTWYKIGLNAITDNIDCIIFANGAVSSSSNKISMPFYTNVNSSSKDVQIMHVRSDNSLVTKYITLQYTKTTD